ncbi:MAG: hypothetical protein IT258_18755 [Saprospiraceae bacterium]|nr:hypothetical protein [Saprospiraceae bacterium]
MPVEIKELHIRVTVNDAESKAKPSANAPASAAIDQDKLIAECVEQVMNILKQKGER